MNEMYLRIEQLCNEKDVTITQMCRDSGVSRAALTELKMGRTLVLSAKNTDRIASYFGVTASYLLGTAQKETTIHNADSFSDTASAPRAAEFAALFSHLSEEQQEFVLAALRGMNDRKD